MWNTTRCESNAFADRQGRSDRPKSASRRRGIAVKELLLVMGAIGAGVVGLKFIDPVSDAQRKPFAGQPELLMEREVLLSDEFVCVVSVRFISPADSSAQPLYMSSVRFAGREVDASGAFLFEVFTTETFHWRATAQCKVWSFVSAEAVLKNRKQEVDAVALRTEMSPQQRLFLLLQEAPDQVQHASTLADPVWSCLPPERKETGILAVAQTTGLDYLQELHGFPLTRLGAAIRTTARNDNWTHDDPQTLFPPKTVTTLPVDQQLKIAQSLVYRLLADLPAEASQ